MLVYRECNARVSKAEEQMGTNDYLSSFVNINKNLMVLTSMIVLTDYL